MAAPEQHEYGPTICPWCEEVLLDTPLEHLRLRVTVFLEHAAVCAARPANEAPERPAGGYGAAIARLARKMPA